jgi:hypothetical protein
MRPSPRLPTVVAPLPPPALSPASNAPLAAAPAAPAISWLSEHLPPACRAGKTLLLDAFKLSSRAVPYLLSLGRGKNTSHRKWYNAGGIDLVALRIDGTEVSHATPYGPITTNVNTRYTNGSVCGVSWWVDTGPQILVGWTAHTAPSVTVRVTNLTTQGSTDESMGIVMVRVWVK